MIRVLIAEDQDLIRQSLEMILSAQPDIQVVGAVGNGRLAVEQAKAERPHVVLMDVRMPEMDGVAATRLIKQLHPDVKVLILTTFDDDSYIHDGLVFGASGYLLKGVSMEELVDAIRSVYRGESLMDRAVTGKLVRMFTQMAQGEQLAPEQVSAGGLSGNERKIVRLIAQGRSNQEIAKQLGFSNGTVRNYISSILEKQGLRDRTQLAIWAVRAGFVKEPS